jgi:hypothetical protein
MGMMIGVAGTATLVAVGIVVWRLWPMLVGSAKPDDLPRDRLAKWNRYVRPLVQKTLEDTLQVGQGGVFTSRQDQREHTITTWSMEAAVLPDVEWVRLTQGTGADQQVLGVASATELRAALGGHAQSQKMFGHTAWVTVVPPGFDLERLDDALISNAEFDATHRMETSEEETA